jgi:iron-sulfur cluster assembly protein
MLTITEPAATAIRTLVSSADLPDGAGLRIDASEQDDGLELAVVPEPQDTDTVVEDSGAAVFLAPAAAEVLDDKVLDIEQVADEDGQAQLRFAVAPQGPGI